MGLTHEPSPAEYRKHLRRGERPCADCKRAWRIKAGERRAAARSSSRRASMGES